MVERNVADAPSLTTDVRQKEMIEELTEAEAILMERVGGATGSMESRTTALRESGVFAEYVEIHRRYVDLIRTSSCGVEALKRALFIQWYAVSEPACFTGILDVDPGSEAEVFSALDAMAEKAQFDAELRYMLAWYHEVSPWYFDNRPDIPNLKSFLAASHEQPRFRKTDFSGRGQMARYWESLNYGFAEQAGRTPRR